MLQCVAVCGSVWQRVAACCSGTVDVISQVTFWCVYVAVCCSVLQCVAVCCSVLQCSHSSLQGVPPIFSIHMLCCVAVCCIVPQCVAVCCNVLSFVCRTFLSLKHARVVLWGGYD